MNTLPPEILSQVLLLVLGNHVQLVDIVKLSHVNTKFKNILTNTLYFWKDVGLHSGDPLWVFENCKVLHKIQSIQARGNDLLNYTKLEKILNDCGNLKRLDLSNCKNISLNQFKNLVNLKLEYLDITGVGENTFSTFEEYHDYWTVGSDLIRDLEEIKTILPEYTLMMPSICQKCKRDTCYPPDTELKCLFCYKNVWWVCDDCELEAYRICYQCVQEDEDNGIDTVICFECLIKERDQNTCPKCDDWKCPNHVLFDCGCTGGAV